MKTYVRFGVMMCLVCVIGGYHSVRAEAPSVRSVEGKSFLIFPRFIAPDINPDCAGVVNRFQIIRLNFGLESELTVVCNTIRDCQEGWYIEADASTIHANVKDCSGPGNADIMSCNFTITLIADMWVTGRYSIESFNNDSNCVEEGEFVGFRLY